jgi:hypothetical protein
MFLQSKVYKITVVTSAQQKKKKWNTNMHSVTINENQKPTTMYIYGQLK